MLTFIILDIWFSAVVSIRISNAILDNGLQSFTSCIINESNIKFLRIWCICYRSFNALGIWVNSHCINLISVRGITLDFWGMNCVKLMSCTWSPCIPVIWTSYFIVEAITTKFNLSSVVSRSCCSISHLVVNSFSNCSMIINRMSAVL